jgi:organic hydroperoxide reductase OsmC/OhrA
MKQKTAVPPYHFKNSILWTENRRGTLSVEQHPSIEVGSPPEFGGTPEVWCPEDLLIGGLNTCLMLTFLAIAQVKGLQVVTYESEAEGTVERSNGKLRITRVNVRPHVKLKSEADLDKAREALKRTKEVCLITNSIIAEVDLIPEIQAAESTAGS